MHTPGRAGATQETISGPASTTNMHKTLALGILGGIVAASATPACTLVQTRVVGDMSMTSAPATIQQPLVPYDAFAPLLPPADAHLELCGADDQHPSFPNDADMITKMFCQDLVPGGSIPAPKSLAELLVILGLDFKNPNGENGKGGNPAFAILGHSSALTARRVTTITPSAFVFTPPPEDGSKPSGFIFLAFDPGEQFVEVASQDPTTGDVNLYIVLFEQACTRSAAGCTPTNLLTPQLVTGWSNVRVYESETALNNTIADCKQCHAPNDKDPQILRMQEITPPFTHWFSAQTEGGRALLQDFHAAHGTKEDYGPIPAAMIDKSDPSLMAKMVTLAGFGQQPNAFDSAKIEAEVRASSAQQPAVNTPRGVSATWRASYDAAAAGRFIAAPYHDVKITDPAKLASMSQAYRAWASGSLAVLPEIRDVFLDDGLRDMGFAPREDADGTALLVQMCRQCHNDNLDQTITRARFSMDHLDTMSRDEKNLAIDRLRLGLNDRLRMPPALFRTVTDDETASMIAVLRR